MALQCFRELGRAGRAPDSLVAPAFGEPSSAENPVARNAAVLLDVHFARFMILMWKWREPDSSLLWALGTLDFTTVTFLALYTVRFSGIGIWLVKFVFLGLLATVLFSIRDLCRSKTRGRSSSHFCFVCQC